MDSMSGTTPCRFPFAPTAAVAALVALSALGRAAEPAAFSAPERSSGGARQSAAADNPAAAISDEQFDAALATAHPAKKNTAEFRNAVQSVAARFPLVQISTEPAKPVWNKLTLNRRGKQLDCIRFRVPEGEACDLLWAFAPAGNVEMWFIVPAEGEMTKGFENFHQQPAAQVFGDQAPAGAKIVYLQTLAAKRLAPGKEYLIWFSLRDDQPSPLHAAVALLPASKSRLSERSVVDALALQPGTTHHFAEVDHDAAAASSATTRPAESSQPPSP